MRSSQVTRVAALVLSLALASGQQGEAHGLRQRDNQKHWTVHMDEFFDHFLLGKPKPEWMDKGVPYLERGRRNVDEMFKPKAATTSPASQDCQ